MQNPCEKCKRTTCPEVCWPRKDYQRGLHKVKRNRGGNHEKASKSVL